jgi:hypothetical protein
MLVALALVAAGVGGVGLGGWLLVGPRTAATPTRPTTRGGDDGTGKSTGKTLPTKKADDGVVRALKASLETRIGGWQYLYVTHQHPGEALEDVTLTVELRGAGGVKKTTTRPGWEADAPLRVEMPPFTGKHRTVHVTGTAKQGDRPVRFDAEVEIDAGPRPGGEKLKGKFGPPIPGATTTPP